MLDAYAKGKTAVTVPQTGDALLELRGGMLLAETTQGTGERSKVKAS
jgi:hypothetical protein